MSIITISKIKNFKVPDKKEVKAFFKHYFAGIYNRADEDHIFLFGSGLAFSLFLCIIPFILIIFSILGAVLEINSVEEQINNFIYTAIPYNEYAAYAKKIVFSRIAEFIEYKTIAGIIGGFGLLFAASGLFSSMRTVLNRIFITKDDKNVVVGKLRDFGMVLLVIVFILMMIIILPAIDILKGVVHKFALFNYLQLSSFEHILVTIISFSMIFLFFFSLYSFIPYAKLGRKVPALSALWAAILWEVAKRLFGYYLSNMATLDKIYGTYALIVVVAFWIYYSSVLFIVGAEIGQLYRERLMAKTLAKNNINPKKKALH